MTRAVSAFKLALLVCISIFVVSYVISTSRFQVISAEVPQVMTLGNYEENELKKIDPEVTIVRNAQIQATSRNSNQVSTAERAAEATITSTVTTSSENSSTKRNLGEVPAEMKILRTQNMTTRREVTEDSPSLVPVANTQNASTTPSETGTTTTISNDGKVTTKLNHSSDENGQKIIPENFFKYLIGNLRDSPYPGVENYIQYSMVVRGRKPLQGHRPLLPDFGKVINDVTSFKYPIKIQPCAKNKGNDSVVVVVTSAPGNFESRQMSRDTWVQQLRVQPGDRHSKIPINLVGFGFVVGFTDNQTIQENIEKESQKYGDILQIGMMDTYYNLTLKKAGLMNWLNKYCSHVDFVFSVDDDVYVNVNNLAIALKRMNESDNILYGTQTYHPTERGGKWGISYEDWPWKMYPPYPIGPAVLITGKSILPLLAASQTVPFLPFEDANFWGVCREKARVKVIDAGRVFALVMAEVPTPCDVFRFLSWDSRHSKPTVSHEATKNFYTNATQCVISNWVNTTVNPMTDEYSGLLD